MCETTKVRKTQTLGELLEFLSGDFGPDKQNVLFETFQEIPIREIRKACVEKIISAGTENFLWLADRIKESLDIGDYDTALLLLRKVAQYKTRDCKEYMDYELIIVVLNEWIKTDNRPALKAGLHILYDKIKEEKLYIKKDTRIIFRKIFEKYDDNNLERTEEDFRMLVDLLGFITTVGDKEYFIPILEKNVVPYNELNERFPFSLCNSTTPISQSLFEIDRGLIVGKGGYKEIAGKARAETKS